MSRDPRPAALAAARKAQGRRDRCASQLKVAQRDYRAALLRAKQSGITNVVLGRALLTSEGRIRQEIARAEMEADTQMSA